MNPQHYYISLDAPAFAVLIRSMTDNTPLFSGPTLVQGDILPIRLFWCRDSGQGGAVQAELAPNSQVVLSARPAGVPVDSPLLFQSNLVWNHEGYHEGTLHLNTLEAADYLAAAPVGAKVILMEAQLADGTTTIRSFQWSATLTPQVYSDQTAPTSLPTPEEWLALRAATSVAGRTGDVTLTTADLTDAGVVGAEVLKASTMVEARNQLQAVGWTQAKPIELRLTYHIPSPRYATLVRIASRNGREAWAADPLGTQDPSIFWDAATSTWTCVSNQDQMRWSNPSTAFEAPATGWIGAAGTTSSLVVSPVMPVESPALVEMAVSQGELVCFLADGSKGGAIPLDPSGVGREIYKAATPAAQRSIMKVPASDPVGISGAVAITNIVRITQAAYNAIAAPDPNVTYIIIP